MGVHDHHIRAKWKDMVEVYMRFGNQGFDGNDHLLEGVLYHSSFNWEKIPAYYLSAYFQARTREPLPLNEQEQLLYDFLKSYSSHSCWPEKPASDLPVESSVVFRPTRVQIMAAQLARLDLDQALERYGIVGHNYLAWNKETMRAHLRKVIDFWNEAAAHGEAVMHTEF